MVIPVLLSNFVPLFPGICYSVVEHTLSCLFVYCPFANTGLVVIVVVTIIADDTCIIITNPNPSKFQEDIKNVVDNIND